jgi:hypothetical protein
MRYLTALENDITISMTAAKQKLTEARDAKDISRVGQAFWFDLVSAADTARRLAERRCTPPIRVLNSIEMANSGLWSGAHVAHLRALVLEYKGGENYVEACWTSDWRVPDEASDQYALELVKALTPVRDLARQACKLSMKLAPSGDGPARRKLQADNPLAAAFALTEIDLAKQWVDCGYSKDMSWQDIVERQATIIGAGLDREFGNQVGLSAPPPHPADMR